MEFINLIDMHTHSVFSFDGNDSCEELCEGALKRGAKAIAITDHCDIDGANLDVDELCNNQIESVKNVSKKYDGRLQVFKGLEIGQGIYRKELTEKLLNDYDYDFILGSLHNLENMEDFYFLDYKKYDIESLLKTYFQDLLELCRWGAFDSLAHLTYPLRYIIDREEKGVDMSKFQDIIDEIFLTLIANNKALEINTSGIFMKMQDTLPNIQYVKRFKDLGGRYITVGSDSHYADKICNGISKGYEIALKAGFKNITVFKNREPFLVNIE